MELSPCRWGRHLDVSGDSLGRLDREPLVSMKGAHWVCEVAWVCFRILGPPLNSWVTLGQSLKSPVPQMFICKRNYHYYYYCYCLVRAEGLCPHVFSRRDSHLSCLLNEFWAIGAGTQLKVLHFAEPRPGRGQSPPGPQRCRPCSKAEGGPLETLGWKLQSSDHSLQLLSPT